MTVGVLKTLGTFLVFLLVQVLVLVLDKLIVRAAGTQLCYNHLTVPRK